MVTYCSTAELIAHTGSALDATTVLTPMIEQGDREIDAYLARYGLTGGATITAVKAASIKIASANLLERGMMFGEYSASFGGESSSVDVVTAAAALRKDAFTILDRYIDAQTSIGTSKITSVRRVDGI